MGLGLFLGIAGLAAAIVLLSRPIWRAEATLRLGAQPNLGGASLAAAGAPAGLMSLFQQMTGDPLANELELIASRSVVEEIVQANALAVTLDAPRGVYRDSVFASLAAGRDTDKATFEVAWLETGGVRVRRTAPSDSLIGDFQPGQPAVFGGIAVVFRAARPSMPEVVELRTVAFGEAVRVTLEKLKAERKRRDANLVRISYDAVDPHLALRVIDSGLEHYSALRGQLQSRESGETTDSLRSLSRNTLEQLRREEDALEGFQRGAGIVAPEAQAEAAVDRRSEIEIALERARVELARTDEVIERLDRAADPRAAWVGLIAHPTFLTNVTLGELLGSLVELEQERIALRGRRTEADGQVQSLDQRIAYLDSSLRSLVREYREGLSEGIRLLEGQRSQFDTELARVPGDALELRRRERSVRLLSEISLFTDQRLWQESLRNAVSFATVQLVDPPTVLFKPIWPRKKLGIGVGLLLGFAFGCLGMALVEGTDRSVRTTREIRERTGAPVIATLVPNGKGFDLTPGDRRLFLYPRNGNGRRRVVLAPAGEESGADAVAHALAREPALETVSVGAAEGREAEAPSVVVGPVVDRYSAAAHLATTVGPGTELLLVVRYGVTSLEDVDRAAALLREAGAGPAGVVVVVDDPRDAGAVWR